MDRSNGEMSLWNMAKRSSATRELVATYLDKILAFL